MKPETKEFINLIDRAVLLAEERLGSREYAQFAPALMSGLKNTLSGLREYRELVIGGQIEASKGVLGLGLIRELLDYP